jgi:acyl carrier protein
MDDIMRVDAGALRDWMVRYITGVLDLPEGEVGTDRKFNEYGLDSVEAVVMAGVMEEEFGVPVDPILLFEHPSIDLFVQAMANGSHASGPPDAGSQAAA